MRKDFCRIRFVLKDFPINRKRRIGQKKTEGSEKL
jgi:hypothetical protein